MLSHKREEAGHVVFREAIVRIDSQSPCCPFLGTIKLAKRCETHGSKVSGPRVFRMQRELALGAGNTFLRGCLHFLLAAERSVNVREHKQGLVVVRLDF